MLPTLTDRESEVAQLLVQGRSYKEIADNLSITLETVRWHIKNIYPKVGVHSRSELAWKTLRHPR